MNIAILGGGNIGTLMGAEFAYRGNNVRMYVSNPGAWSNDIQVFNSQEKLVRVGHLDLVTDELSKVVDGADIVWVTYPTFMLEEAAKKLLPYIVSGMRIGVVPGNDAEFFFSEHVDRGAILFGLQRVHSIARLKERGKSVYELGRKSEIFVAALPSKAVSTVAAELNELFDMPVVELPNYLVETLTPSNPILHTARIRSMFRDWAPGFTYNRNILFYEEWNIDSAELLIACDKELQAVCRELEMKLGIDLGYVKSLCDYYESPSPEAMCLKISRIPAFKGLTSPMKEVDGSCQWVPDFQSRYFRADFAFGLKAIKDIAEIAKVDTPNICDVYDWYVNTSPNVIRFEGVPQTLRDLIALYQK